MSWVTALLASLAGPAGISHVSLPARVSHVGLSCRFSGRDPKAWVLQRGAPGSDGHSGASLQVEKRRVNLPRALSAPPVAGTACHAYDREVHLRCELSPGFYLAVPSTCLGPCPCLVSRELAPLHVSPLPPRTIKLA